MGDTYSVKELGEMYCKHQYSKLIEMAYPAFEKFGIRKGARWQNDWNSCKLLCSALFLSGYYYDCLITMKAMFSDVKFESENLEAHDRAHFVECALESLLYFVFNKSSLVANVEEKIEFVLKEAPLHYGNCNEYDDKKFHSIKSLYEKYKDGKVPYYSVSFFAPIVLDFDHYTFDLTGAHPYRSMTINKEKRGTVNGTVFSVMIDGFIKADSWWEGPVWGNRRKLAATTLALNLVNRLLLIIAEGDTHNFMPRIRHEQLTSVILCQYMGDGEIYGFCDGTMFDGHFMKEWVQRPEYTHEELRRINRLLISNCNNPLYATLYHQAQNTMYAGLYEESIMLFFACIEATVHYWSEYISKLSGIDTEYEEFEKCKSVCRDCSLFRQQPEGKGVSILKLPPSIRRYPTFLRKHKIINKDQEKLLRKLIIDAQNDNLRNDMMHGKNGSVTFYQVEECRKTIYRLNEQFLAIANKYAVN